MSSATDSIAISSRPGAIERDATLVCIRRWGDLIDFEIPAKANLDQAACFVGSILRSNTSLLSSCRIILKEDRPPDSQ